jgi:hypothetical protein
MWGTTNLRWLALRTACLRLSRLAGAASWAGQERPQSPKIIPATICQACTHLLSPHPPPRESLTRRPRPAGSLCRPPRSLSLLTPPPRPGTPPLWHALKHPVQAQLAPHLRRAGPSLLPPTIQVTRECDCRGRLLDHHRPSLFILSVCLSLTSSLRCAAHTRGRPPLAFIAPH